MFLLFAQGLSSGRQHNGLMLQNARKLRGLDGRGYFKATFIPPYGEELPYKDKGKRKPKYLDFFYT